MSYHLPPPLRPATEAQVAAAVREMKSYVAAAVITGLVVLRFGIVVVGPFTQRVL